MSQVPESPGARRPIASQPGTTPGRSQGDASTRCDRARSRSVRMSRTNLVPRACGSTDPAAARSALILPMGLSPLPHPIAFANTHPRGDHARGGSNSEGEKQQERGQKQANEEHRTSCWSSHPPFPWYLWQDAPLLPSNRYPCASHTGPLFSYRTHQKGVWKRLTRVDYRAGSDLERLHVQRERRRHANERLRHRQRILRRGFARTGPSLSFSLLRPILA